MTSDTDDATGYPSRACWYLYVAIQILSVQSPLPEKDLDFLNAIVGMMLKDGEMYRLKEKIKYDFETERW